MRGRRQAPGRGRVPSLSLDLVSGEGTPDGYRSVNGGECAALKNAKCKMQNAKCKMQNAKCKMQNAKCKMQNAKCKMQNAK
jgi:hypothetical protein